MAEMPKITRNSSRKAEVTIRMSEFEIPPIQDVLIIGKRSPIGPEAVRQMIESISPDQYSIFNIDDHDIIEAIVIRNNLLKMMPKNELFNHLLNEAGKVISETSVLKAQVNVVLEVKRMVDF